MAGGREGRRQELEPAAGVLDWPPIPHSTAFGGQTARSGSTSKSQVRAPAVIAVGISYSSLVWSCFAPSRQLSCVGTAIDNGHEVRFLAWVDSTDLSVPPIWIFYGARHLSQVPEQLGQLLITYFLQGLPLVVAVVMRGRTAELGDEPACVLNCEDH